MKEKGVRPCFLTYYPFLFGKDQKAVPDPGSPIDMAFLFSGRLSVIIPRPPSFSSASDV